MKKTVFTLLFLYLGFCSVHSQIILDESYDDWSEEQIIFTDPLGDGALNGLDFSKIYVTNDENYLFIRFSLEREINIQDNNNLSINIDIDNNASTGFQVNGLGAEIRYFFGSRTGNAKINNQIFQIRHDDIGLVTLPSVTSDEFEIAIKRSNPNQNPQINFSETIRICFEDDTINGDQAPDNEGGITFSFNPTTPELPAFYINKIQEGHIRVTSYNALFDNIFDPVPSAAFGRIIKAIKPDIIGFQEIYDHSAEETENLVSSFLPDGIWYSAEDGPDIKLVSRYPIIEVDRVDGNGVFLLDMNGQEVILFNAHLPCCDNESGRQAEADHLMSYIRNSREGGESIQISINTPIIIIGDMNLVGQRAQQQTLITGNIIEESSYGPDFNPDWDESELEDAKPITTGLPMTVTWGSESSFSPGRLDYLIYSGSVMNLTNSFALNTESLSDQQLAEFGLLRSDTKTSSDHFALVGDFTIAGVNSTDNSSINANFSAYPNPSSGSLQIEAPYDPVRLTIFNAEGRMVMTLVKPDLDHHISINNLAKGSYFLVLDFGFHQESKVILIK